MDVIARHLSVAHQKASCRQRSKTASYNICALLVHTLRFLRAGKRLVISVRIVNTLAVLLMFPAFRVAVLLFDRLFHCLFLRFLLRILVTLHCRRCCDSGACRERCCSDYNALFLSHANYRLSL